METRKVLYMEDNELFADMVAAELKERGYSVRVAEDGEAGMNILQKESFDAILLDLLMPKIDGYEVLRRIKQDPRLSAIPIAVLSNLTNEEDFNRTRDLGAAVFLVKAQSTPKDISDTVDQILAR